MDSDDTDALERLKRLAQQADDLKVSPPPKSSASKPRRSYDVNYLTRAPKHGQNNTNRNAVLVFAAGLVSPGTSCFRNKQTNKQGTGGGSSGSDDGKSTQRRTRR